MTFAILLTVAIGIRLVYVVLLPPSQTVSFRLEGLNDEASHLNYVHYLAQHRSFPVQRHHAREKDAFAVNEFEYYQAPLYYVIGAGLELVVGKANTLLACRLLSFLFGVLSLLVIRRIFSAASLSAAAGNGAMLFAAHFPTHAYFCSAASNDSMSWLIALLMTLELVRMCSSSDASRTRSPLRAGAYFGLLLGIGMLTKASLFLFAPVAAGVFVWLFFGRREPGRLYALVAMLCVAAVCAGPWYLRNLRVYGSLFAFGVGNGPPQFFLFAPEQFVRFVKIAVYCFWFPMQHVPPSHVVAAILGFELLVLGVNAWLFAKYVLAKKTLALWETVLGCLLLLNLAAYINYNLRWDNADGRFLFPSLAALLVIFCVPLEQLCERHHWKRFYIPFLAVEALFPYCLLLLVP
ncbi:MAG TPA: glycosyltransferase family 39 protein [Chitinivibrionales bacterium]|nr:glycosyltransferase family 39 protein [Chitinivibrionales bacterium]